MHHAEADKPGDKGTMSRVSGLRGEFTASNRPSHTHNDPTVAQVCGRVKHSSSPTLPNTMPYCEGREGVQDGVTSLENIN